MTCSNWHLNFEIPSTFSMATNDVLSKGNKLEITDQIRNEIVSSLATSILKFTMTPTSDQYTRVCYKLIESYPILEDPSFGGKSTVKIVCLSVAIV